MRWACRREVGSVSTSSTPRWAPWAWPKSVARPIRADAPGRLELRPAILSNGAVGEREFLRLDGTDIVFPSGVSRDGRFVIFQRVGGGTAALVAVGVAAHCGPEADLLQRRRPRRTTTPRGCHPAGDGWRTRSTNRTGMKSSFSRSPIHLGPSGRCRMTGGMFPVWRRDGRGLYYVTPPGDVVAVSVVADSTFA